MKSNVITVNFRRPQKPPEIDPMVAFFAVMTGLAFVIWLIAMEPRG